jgi:dienelactone hydrolase
MERNLSQNARFRQIAAEHTPAHRFAGSSAEDFTAWKQTLLPAVRDTLGAMPERVDLNPEILAEWRADGLIKQKVVFDVEPGLSATAYVFRPADATRPLPGILACHGHGPFGKEPVMGVQGSAEIKASIATHRYDYGFQMARAGVAVIAIDWRGFGERDDRRRPNQNDTFFGRDICNVHYIRADILGATMLGLNVNDGMRALDYFTGLDFVDADRIGVMGLSFGGTMTTWMAMCDERIKAADIICYSDRFADFALTHCNFCGSQITPGLFTLCDVPDLQGLIAPRPLLIEIGAYDECFRIASAMSCYRETEKIYAAAGASDKLQLDLFDGPHAWSGRSSQEFFRTHLG